MSGVHYLEVSDDEDGQRLDRFLQKHLKGVPFGLLQKLMRKGQIRVDSKRVKPSTRLASGQSVRIPPLEDKPIDRKPRISGRDVEMMHSIVLYDQNDILAVNKPAGLATQGGTNIKKHLDGLLEVLKDENGVKPRLVHRLDKDTSGVLILARSSKMATALGDLFQRRQVKKTYWALTVPAPEINEGEMRLHLLKMEDGDREKMTVSEKGQKATTYFDIMERAHKQLAFVAFWPKTGRKHQIRVHAAHMGTPIVGDRKYGGADAILENIDCANRLHLHAKSIEFKHPVTNKDVYIEAALPNDLKESWTGLGFNPYHEKIPFKDIKL